MANKLEAFRAAFHTQTIEELRAERDQLLEDIKPYTPEQLWELWDAIGLDKNIYWKLTQINQLNWVIGDAA